MLRYLTQGNGVQGAITEIKYQLNNTSYIETYHEHLTKRDIHYMQLAFILAITWI